MCKIDLLPKVAIIGPSSWIGAHVAMALATGHDVESFSARDPHLSELSARLRDFRPNTIVNCVGRMHGDEAELRHANVTILRALLSTASEINAQLLTMGSAAEYGDTGDYAVGEQESCNPKGTYGTSKLEATMHVSDAHASGVQATVLRVFNVIGRDQPGGTAISDIHRRINEAAITHTPTVVVDNYDIVRDYVLVDDVANAIRGLIGMPLPAVMNVGSGQGNVLNDVACAIGRRAGVVVDSGQLHKERVRYMVADTRVIEDFGFRPRAFDPYEIARHLTEHST